MPVPLQSVGTLDDLAVFLGYADYESMKGLLYPTPRYTTFSVPKRSGGTRLIETPGRKLKEMQRRVAADLKVCFGNRSRAVHSFVPDRSVVSNARPHVARACVVRVDLKDFFHQINFGRVKGVFLSPPLSLPNDVATVLAHLCCYNGRLPQGAPTSPVLSNFVCLALDSKLRKLAKRYKARYTRYADDLTFSFASIPLGRVPAELFVVSEGPSRRVSVESGVLLEEVVAKQGFAINHAKTTGANRDRRQMVTGIVVNDGLRVPSKYTDHVRRALHLWLRFGEHDAALRALPVLMRKAYASGRRPSLPKIIQGKLGWLGFVHGRANQQYQSLAKKFNALVVRDGLAHMQLQIDPQVKNYPEAQAATWFLTAETDAPEYDVIEGTAFKVVGQEWVTCAHCIGDRGAQTVYPRLKIAPGDWSFKAFSVRVHKIDWHRDLAVLRPAPMVPVPRHLAYFTKAGYVPIDRAEVGVMGFPSSIENQPPVFIGANVVRTRPISGVLRIEIDKPIQQGNSGGPVFDREYKVVGVVVEGATVSSGMNSCIAVTELDELT